MAKEIQIPQIMQRSDRDRERNKIYLRYEEEDEKTDQEKENRLADVWNNDDGGGIRIIKEFIFI